MKTRAFCYHNTEHTNRMLKIIQLRYDTPNYTFPCARHIHQHLADVVNQSFWGQIHTELLNRRHWRTSVELTS
jgi:hypothetical protein